MTLLHSSIANNSRLQVQPHHRQELLKEKKHPKPVKHAHKSGEGVKKPLQPVNSCRWKVKHNLSRLVTTAVLSPMLLHEPAIAQVPLFDFRSEITRLKCGSSCEHNYLSI